MSFETEVHWDMWAINVAVGKERERPGWIFFVTLGPFSAGVSW